MTAASAGRPASLRTGAVRAGGLGRRSGPGLGGLRRRPPCRRPRRPARRRSCPASRSSPRPRRAGAPTTAAWPSSGVQVAEALAYAHARGRRPPRHQAVEPAARRRRPASGSPTSAWPRPTTTALTHTGDILGTLRYMAPERFRGRSDAAERRLQPGPDALRAADAAAGLRVGRPAGADRAGSRTRSRPARARLDPRIPRDLETIVLKAIAKEPARRYPTAEELAEDLRRFLEDRPIRARRASSAERLLRWCRRNAVAGLLASLGRSCSCS